MKIGCPKEIKPQEFRVGMTPGAVREAVAHGHEVLVETGAGTGSGFADAEYAAAGARVVADAAASGPAPRQAHPRNGARAGRSGCAACAHRTPCPARRAR